MNDLVYTLFKKIYGTLYLIIIMLLLSNLCIYIRESMPIIKFKKFVLY